MKSRILIVDDEQIIRDSLGEILQIEGYSITSIDSANAATEAIQTNEFDIILLDLKMPGMDGLEVLRTAARLAPDTKVIILTGHGSIDSAVEALRLGAFDYIQKPAQTRTILNSITQALIKRAEQQQKRLLLEQLESTVRRLKDIEGMEKAFTAEKQVLTLGEGIILDMSRREIWHGNQKVNLTPTEGKLMKILFDHRSQVLSHRELVFMVQGYETTDWEAPEVLRPLVSRLRRKLSLFSGGEQWIVNVRGTGYVFDANGRQASGSEEGDKLG